MGVFLPDRSPALVAPPGTQRSLPVSSIKQNIETVLHSYLSAKEQPFANHPLAHLIRHEFTADLNNVISVIGDKGRVRADGSPGKGNWANCPWVAVLDLLVTSTVKSGYYPVYLFKEDMAGVYLSLNQGVTEIKEKYKVDAKEVLSLRAQDFRAQLGKTPSQFNELSINLVAQSKSELASFYEAGNIFARYYELGNIPAEDELIQDLKEILKIYDFLVYNENASSNGGTSEGANLGVEDGTRLRMHMRIERNAVLIRSVKKLHGYDCEACGFCFDKKYGVLGEEFIEAHHLVPVAELKGKKIALDPKEDFAVLCSNCHRMIHKANAPKIIEEFKKVIS